MFLTEISGKNLNLKLKRKDTTNTTGNVLLLLCPGGMLQLTFPKVLLQSGVIVFVTFPFFFGKGKYCR